MKLKKSIFEYGVDFLYLIGGLIVFVFGVYIAYFGVGFDNDGDAFIEKVLLSLALIISGFLYLRYAFHLNYSNKYTRVSLLLIICSFFPYLEFSSITFDGDMNTYMLSIASIFSVFIFLLVTSLILLFIGYMKGRTDLENVDIQPKVN